MGVLHTEPWPAPGGPLVPAVLWQASCTGKLPGQPHARTHPAPRNFILIVKVRTAQVKSALWSCLLACCLQKSNKEAQRGRGRRMRQALVDFYRSYRFNMFSEGKYDAAGTVVAKTKPVNLVHHRYQLVNHYPPVAATQARARVPRGRLSSPTCK